MLEMLDQVSGARRPAQNLPHWYPDTGPRHMLYRTPDINADGSEPIVMRIPGVQAFEGLNAIPADPDLSLVLSRGHRGLSQATKYIRVNL